MSYNRSNLLTSNALQGLPHSNFETHVARILVTHLPAMKLTFDDLVDCHIEHPHSELMSQRSEVVRYSLIIVTVLNS